MSWEPLRPQSGGPKLTCSISVTKFGLTIGANTMKAIKRPGYNFVAVAVNDNEKAIRFSASKDPNDFAWPASSPSMSVGSARDVAVKMGYTMARYSARIDKVGDGTVYAVLLPDAEKWPLLRAAVVEETP